MSSTEMIDFFKSLDNVKQEYTCGVCSELCKDPVTLSKCFHLICGDHFKDLKTCPTCNVALDDCRTFPEKRMQKAIQATKELHEMFDKYRQGIGTGLSLSTSDQHQPKHKIKSSIDSKTSDSKQQKENSRSQSETQNSKSKQRESRNSLMETDIVQEKREKRTVLPENSNKKQQNLLKKPEAAPRSKRLISKDSLMASDDLLHEEIVQPKNISETSNKRQRKLSKKAIESSNSKLESKILSNESPIEGKTAFKISTETSHRRLRLRKPSKTETEDLSLSNTTMKLDKALEKRNHKGETVLHIACRLGQVEKVKELLKQGANVNTKDNAGWTPLHEVVQNGRIEIVKLLLENNALINVPGPSNETPLHEAVRYNHKNIVQELVRHGADMNARNCKGETPSQLAKEDMGVVLELAADNIVQTQTGNITLISSFYSEIHFDDIKVHCISSSKTVHNHLKELVKYHKNMTAEPKFTNKVTHLIVDCEHDRKCVSSTDVLQGIVSSLWILSSEWLMKSTKEKLEPFQEYEVKGVGTPSNQGPYRSRYNKYKQLPGVFDGCHFYLHNFNSKYEVSKTMVLTKAILGKLISDAGGKVLRRTPNPESIPVSEKLVPYHAKKDGALFECAHYIIFKDVYEPMYNMKHLKALPIGWLIECIEKYELCEPW